MIEIGELKIQGSNVIYKGFLICLSDEMYKIYDSFEYEDGDACPKLNSKSLKLVWDIEEAIKWIDGEKDES